MLHVVKPKKVNWKKSIWGRLWSDWVILLSLSISLSLLLYNSRPHSRSLSRSQILTTAFARILSLSQDRHTHTHLHTHIQAHPHALKTTTKFTSSLTLTNPHTVWFESYLPQKDGILKRERPKDFDPFSEFLNNCWSKLVFSWKPKVAKF